MTQIPLHVADLQNSYRQEIFFSHSRTGGGQSWVDLSSPLGGIEGLVYFFVTPPPRLHSPISLPARTRAEGMEKRKSEREGEAGTGGLKGEEEQKERHMGCEKHSSKTDMKRKNLWRTEGVPEKGGKGEGKTKLLSHGPKLRGRARVAQRQAKEKGGKERSTVRLASKKRGSLSLGVLNDRS